MPLNLIIPAVLEAGPGWAEKIRTALASIQTFVNDLETRLGAVEDAPSGGGTGDAERANTMGVVVYDELAPQPQPRPEGYGLVAWAGYTERPATFLDGDWLVVT